MTDERESYLDIKGWFDFEELYQTMVALAPEPAHFVEVGSCFGKSTAFMALLIQSSRKRIRLDAVDTWVSNYPAFFANMVRLGVSAHVKPMRMPSHLAALHYQPGSLDFVFIDADHRYNAVCHDIRLWLPRVKPGGFLGGHDIQLASVKRAVEELIGEFEVTNQSWLFRVKSTT